MTRPSQTLLAPLFAVLAMLLALTGSVSATFNDAATEPHYGNFLLWQSEASGDFAYEEAHPTREIGVWIYDDTSGVLAYVTQNPWGSFDPLGLNKVTVSGGINPDRKKDDSHDWNWENSQNPQKPRSQSRPRKLMKNKNGLFKKAL